MATRGKPKLSDAIPRPLKFQPNPAPTRVEASPKTLAEQVREAQEARKARQAQASIRDRMVEIGRGNQQAGRS